MGEVGMSRSNAGWQRRIALAVLFFAAVSGCTSSSPARVVEAKEATPAQEPAPRAAGSPSSAASAPAAPAGTGGAAAPAEIRTMELREGAPEVYLDLEASSPLVWTSFRNPEGKVVVELPNAVPSTRVQDVAPEDGLVSSVKVQRETEGNRPMTRLVIATRHDVEHSVTADGLHLQIRLLPLDTQAAAAHPAAATAPTAPRTGTADGAGKQKLAFEPVPPGSAAAPPPAAPAPATPANTETVSARLVPTKAGTPEEPAIAPAPAGTPATRLEGIEVLAAEGGGTVIRISGDGDFPYSTFALSDPSRFVIDLQGVVNHSPRSTLAVQSSLVQRVRVAQFRPGPKGVARVVFDLKQGTVPHIERAAQSLVVSFQEGGANANPATAAVTAPAATPATIQPRVAAAAPPPAEPPPPPPTPAPVRTKPARTAKSSPPPMPAGSGGGTGSGTPAASPASSSPAAQAAAPSDLSLRPAGGGTQVAALGRAPGGVEVEDAPPVPSGRKGGNDLPRVAQGSNSLTQPSADLGRRQDGGANTKLAGDITGTDHPYTGEPIDLKVTNADVTEVLRTFAQISGLNIVVQPGVTGTVTAELENVPWDQAFEEVLKINNLGYEREGNVIRIAPNNILRQEATERQQLAQARALVVPLRTVMRRLSYANAQNVATLLKSGQAGLLTQRGSVIVDDRTNTLIIKELPDFLDAVLAVISNLDTPEPQVMIEARIIETTKTFSRSLGINWGFNAVSDAAHGNTTGLIFPNNGTLSGQVTLDQPANGTLNLSLGNVLNTFKLDLALEAAESEGLVNILSAPKVATLNNQLAYIQSGVQIPVQTIANNTVTVQYINATLRLEVTPQVTAEGTVVMDINISKKEPETGLLVANATNAPISTKDAKTRLVVRDGGTAVIGGIYKVTTDASENRVPGLASLPFVGYLFRNKERDQTNDELLIFITPRVIKI